MVDQRQIQCTFKKIPKTRKPFFRTHKKDTEKKVKLIKIIKIQKYPVEKSRTRAEPRKGVNEKRGEAE